MVLLSIRPDSAHYRECVGSSILFTVKLPVRQVITFGVPVVWQVRLFERDYSRTFIGLRATLVRLKGFVS